MVFFVAMPVLLGAFGNFLIPLMIGARDMAFPRLNLASFWTLFVGIDVLLLASFFVPGGASRAGWTELRSAVRPRRATPERYWGGNLWLMALAIDFASVLMGGINFLTTAIAMRAPGMTMVADAVDGVGGTGGKRAVHAERRPASSPAVVMLLFDRMVGTGFFLPDKGADPLLWQHLFWFFGHPEVYVVAMPGLGIVRRSCPSSRASRSSAIR